MGNPVQLLGFAHHLLEQLTVFVEQPYERLLIDFSHFEHRFRYFVHATLDHRLLRSVSLFLCHLLCLFLHFAAVQNRTLNEQVRAQASKQHHCDHTAPHQAQSYQEGDGKGDQRCKEPACYYGQYSGDPVHCALASPGTVGQRRTHRYHKGNVSRRKRQLQRRSHRDQDRGDRQIHRGTYQIKRRFVLGLW